MLTCMHHYPLLSVVISIQSFAEIFMSVFIQSNHLYCLTFEFGDGIYCNIIILERLNSVETT